MNGQLIRIAPLQAAKVSAVLYFIMGVLFALPMTLITLLASAPEGSGQSVSLGWGLVLLMPFIYAILGFIFVPIACWIYNLVARWVGGFEITLQESGDA